MQYKTKHRTEVSLDFILIYLSFLHMKNERRIYVKLSKQRDNPKSLLIIFARLFFSCLSKLLKIRRNEISARARACVE